MLGIASSKVQTGGNADKHYSPIQDQIADRLSKQEPT